MRDDGEPGERGARHAVEQGANVRAERWEGFGSRLVFRRANKYECLTGQCPVVFDCDTGKQLPSDLRARRDIGDAGSMGGNQQSSQESQKVLKAGWLKLTACNFIVDACDDGFDIEGPKPLQTVRNEARVWHEGSESQRSRYSGPPCCKSGKAVGYLVRA